MNKSGLIEQLASRAKLSPRLAALVVKTTFDGMAEALVRGERIELRNFGVLKIRGYQGRPQHRGSAALLLRR